MGLLDSVVGAVMNNLEGAQGGQGGGLSALLPVITSMLSNDGQQGGLNGLIEKFNQAGLGEQMSSWISTGQNLPINGEQISQVFGSGALGDIAAKLGVDTQQASGMLAEYLPNIIDKLTPDGQAPAGGLGGSADLMGMLGSLLQKR